MTDAEDPNGGGFAGAIPPAESPTEAIPVTPGPTTTAYPAGAYASGPAMPGAGGSEPTSSVWKSPLGIAVIVVFALVLAGGVTLAVMASRDDKGGTSPSSSTSSSSSSTTSTASTSTTTTESTTSTTKPTSTTSSSTSSSSTTTSSSLVDLVPAPPATAPA